MEETQDSLNVLIVNGAKQFGTSQGEFNLTLVAAATKVFTERGCNVNVTNVDQSYNLDNEVSKILWADLVVYQTPIWHMGLPWVLKKYIDEVFYRGKDDFYADYPACSWYGGGGKLVNKFYMVSMTWRAPARAFTAEPGFLRGASPDSVIYGFHKANEYFGLKTLPSFVSFDVEGRPKVAMEIDRYRRHLNAVLDSHFLFARKQHLSALPLTAVSVDRRPTNAATNLKMQSAEQ